MPETKPAVGKLARAFGVPDTDRLERELRDRLDTLIGIGKETNALLVRLLERKQGDV